MKALVTVRGEGERREAGFGDVDAELLLELADQRRLRRLARQHLTARKLPKPGHRLALRALRQQHAPVGVDERDGDDENDREFGAFSSGSWH